MTVLLHSTSTRVEGAVRIYSCDKTCHGDCPNVRVFCTRCGVDVEYANVPTALVLFVRSHTC